MGSIREDIVRASYKDCIQSNQCILHFYLDAELPRIGYIKEEIRTMEQRSKTVHCMLQGIKNTLIKILLDNHKDKIQSNENVEKLVKDIVVSLNKGNESILGSMKLKDISNFFDTNNITLQVHEQKFLVVLNAPVVRQLKLPIIMFPNFSTQPIKYHAPDASTKHSLFHWYRSTDEILWEKIGEGFKHTFKDSDLGFYIKLVCIPATELNVFGPSIEDVSESKVQQMRAIPFCPFEKRHEFTKIKLKGLNFRVVSYNILADRYSDTGSFLYCPPEVLAIDYRKQVILKELLGYNADIICLQEVDNRHYTTYFKEEFKRQEYDSMYHRKGNKIPEGMACIFNRKRYKLLLSRHVVLGAEIQRHKVFAYIWNVLKNSAEAKTFVKQSTSLQITVLKDKGNNKCVVVGNTHLFYRPDADHLRLIQVYMATTYLQMIRRTYLREGLDVSVIFCGDFNSNPNKSVYPFMIQGRIDSNHQDCLKFSDGGPLLLYHEFSFKSVYETPKYTNYTAEFKDCLDYIFVESNKLKVERVTPLPSEQELSKYEGLPNEHYPSDHLALVVDLKFK